MSDASTTTTGAATTAAATTTTATAAAATATAAWHTGHADAEMLGHWQNKLPADALGDPIKVAIEMTKQARAAEKFVGAPPDSIIRLPKDAKDETGWRDVWSRLGAPKEAKEYDFTTIKSADGKDVDPALADALRAAAFDQHLPKDAATKVASTITKYLDDQRAAQEAEATTKVAAERAELMKSWGPNADMNKLQAMQGAKRLGITPEAIAALEKVSGYASVMEAMRKVGAGTTEDTFVEGKGGGMPATAPAAQARLNELINDRAWGERLTKGDAAAVREFNALTEQIAAAA